MSEIKRLTLISDPTDEFPNNANNSFKVRLPERLSLPGAGWHASLLSLTVPDQGQSNAVIAADPHTKVVKFSLTYLTRLYMSGSYRRVSFKTKDYGVELEDIMSSKQSVTTGSEFWKRVMQEVHNKVMQALLNQQESALTFNADQRPIVSVKKNWMPMMTWKDDVLVLHAVPKGDVLKSDKSTATTRFMMDLGIGWFCSTTPRRGGLCDWAQSPIHLPYRDLHRPDPAQRFILSLAVQLEWRAFCWDATHGFDQRHHGSSV